MMSIPLATLSPLGRRTEYVFEPPYSRANFIYMDALLEDASLNGFTAIRLIDDDSVRVIISITETEKV